MKVSKSSVVFGAGLKSITEVLSAPSATNFPLYTTLAHIPVIHEGKPDESNGDVRQLLT